MLVRSKSQWLGDPSEFRPNSRADVTDQAQPYKGDPDQIGRPIRTHRCYVAGRGAVSAGDQTDEKYNKVASQHFASEPHVPW